MNDDKEEGRGGRGGSAFCGLVVGLLEGGIDSTCPPPFDHSTIVEASECSLLSLSLVFPCSNGCTPHSGEGEGVGS